MSLDGFSTQPLVQELRDALTGGRIDKITQPSKASVFLSIRQPGRNHLLHIAASPQASAVFLAQRPPENPAEPPLFCMVLRKQLEGSRIADIRQHALDRIIVFDFDSLAAGGKIVTKTLIVELIGKYSNIILVQDGRIIDALRKVGSANSRTRLILPAREYAPPPAQEKLDLRTTAPAAVIDRLIQEPAATLFKGLLNSCLGFGPASAREVIFSAGLPEKMLCADLDAKDKDALIQALAEVSAACTEEEAAPCLIIDRNNKVLATAPFPLHYLSPEHATLSFPTISAMLEKATLLAGAYTPPEKDRLKKFVKTELSRAENKLDVLKEELRQAENAEDYKIRGDNLMTYAHLFQDHEDASLTVDDIYSETGEKITLKLDQRLTLSQNMQAFYHKYDKLKRAQKLLDEQIALCSENIRYLASVETSLAASSALSEIEEIKEELIESGFLKEGKKKKRQDKPSAPFQFMTEDGKSILVGKNKYQNYRLTFRTAAPDDLWLHAKDIPGSHVILRLSGEEPSEESLHHAAILAAHFSKAQDSSNVPVDYTYRRYVKKPSGSRPGFVIFTHQKTLYVTPSADEAAKLLQEER
ncbi:NFACT RNA binding domain-containing protein [uncultured Selenomonas sp.]|uniref:Rqc2 family fibronectin-binding protein n=1 Tax=uncultured Selenomonas sp. TaxID=159275 RepID=UPI0028DB4B08|nr:NFACT RNA binding domain-containing protein [uncultured Selenomonas sp.]